MWLNRLEITNFRCHPHLTMEPGSAPWILLTGSNGAGKTSLMEAVYMAARGRSFRHAALGEMIRTDQDATEILVVAENGGTHRVGVRFSRHSRDLHLDGQPARGLADITRALPVEYLGAATHRLVDGPPAGRRRFMDWALFHVEPRFLGAWRLWHRAHRQRNEWLRRREYSASESWIELVARHGEAISKMRTDLVERLAARLRASPGAVVQGRRASIRFRPGWHGDSLGKDLRATAERERRLGRAVVGPQYDDWLLEFGELRAGQLSRGQSKLASLFLWRELGRMMLETGHSPILFVDDFLADLDENSVKMAISALDGAAGQVWLTAQGESPPLALPGEASRFHVEHGRVEVGW